MTKAQDIVGSKIGRLKIISIKKRDRQGRPIYEALCECGNKSYPRKDYLNNRGIFSHCGCRNGLSYEEKNNIEKEKRKSSYAKNLEINKLNSRKNKYKIRYKITLEQYEKMLQNQKSTCFICKKHQSNMPKSYGRLVIDHCHKTGKIRGLLCRSCNSGIGQLKDSETLLRRAIHYLAREST